VISDLLDVVLSQDVVDATNTGVVGFCRRYGFKEEPLQVRFRILDRKIRLLPSGKDQDVTLTQDDFSSLDLPVSTVFITENKINFLSFPEIPGAMAIFGAGYGFDNLSDVPWFHRKKIHYWGDIDTHGFAILNQLRGKHPHVESFLMDQQTLLDHRSLWVTEPSPEICDLVRLNEEERRLYEQLRDNHFGDRVRLEQEVIGFRYLLDALRKI